MVTYRIDRLNREFLRSIAALLSSRIKDPTAAEAVLTNVDTARDLSVAKVYFTVIDPSRRNAVQSALTNAAGKLRGALGKEMHIRQIPELRFVYDDSERRAREMDELIDRVMKEEHERV